MYCNVKNVQPSFLVLIFFISGTVNAADIAETAISRLAALLVGEFDSKRQAQEDIANDVDENAAHGRVNRTFALVDAPVVGDVVLIGTTSYGVSPWLFDTDEFLVWTFASEADGESIVMSPQRFKDNERRIPFAFNASKLAGFTPNDLEPAISGASCDIVWSLTQNGYTGQTKPCRVMSTTRNKMLSWDWQYELTSTAMWISFSGEDEAGNVLDGTPAGAPYRLDRLNPK